MREISELEFNPVIRGANYFSSDNVKFGPRCNYAYQLLYVYDGSGTAEVNGRYYNLEPGMLFMYGPGQRHEFRSNSGSFLTLGTVNFSGWIVTAEKLRMGNTSVSEKGNEFARYADELVRFAGLPELPFIMMISKESGSQLGMLIRQIHREQKGYGSQLVMKARLLEIFMLLKAESGLNPPEQNSKLIEFEEYIRANYHRDLKRSDVSSHLKLSQSYLTALLGKELETNFTDYLTRVRLDKAMELVQFSDLLVKEISDRTGFKSVSYFVRRFGEYFGAPPNKFRN